MMRIATWNVNSIRAREELVLDWLQRNQVDVLCLQETKVVDDEFPTDEIQRLGYAVAMAGQQTYNGVAIASRLPFKEVTIGLHGDTPASDKRLITASIAGIRISSAYVPNGKKLGAPSFKDKLAWLRRLGETLDREEPAPQGRIIAGDYNIAPDDRDVFDPEGMRGQLHFSDEEHAALADLQRRGLTDAFRLHVKDGGCFSWWDYRAGSHRKNEGLRIDLVLVSEQVAARCTAAYIDTEERKRPKPSDHVPVVIELSEP